MPFDRAHDFTIANSVLNEAHRDVHNVTNNNYNTHNNTTWDPLKLLFDTAASGALHSSEEIFPRTGCHPDTRATVLREIMGWMEGSHRVFWLHGAAGAGKSAIMQTVAERCAAQGKLVATFFFLRGDSERSHGKHFCATLATQIYSMIPETRYSLRQAIIDNPLIFKQSLGTQFRKLFVEPLQAFSSDATNLVVIIDGLDECQEPRTQNEILLMIGNSLGITPPLHVHFLIASRPEPNIRKAFDRGTLRKISRHILLGDSYESRRDIYRYLRTGFAEIHENHESMQSIAGPWPSDEVLDRLVFRSSGQFVYAATVLKFIGDEDFLPIGRLKTVIDASDSRALSALDGLYLQILLSCHPDNTDCLHTVLAMILVAQHPTCELIDSLLAIETGQSRLVLRGLHSLLSIPVDGSEPGPFSYIGILHKSFSDFLQDPVRSGRFFVDVAVFHAWLSKRCMQWIFERQDDILLRRLEGSNRRQCDYALEHWSHHIANSPDRDVSLTSMLRQFEHDVCLLDGFEQGRSELSHWLRKQPGCHDRLIESLESRRSNIFLNLTSQWSIKPNLNSSSFTADHYISGDLSTAAGGATWRRAVVLYAIQNWRGMWHAWNRIDLAPYDAITIAQVLDDDVGSAVRQFRDTTLFGSRSEEDHVEYSQAILSILRKLTLVERFSLSSRSIHPTLVEEFAQALHQMHELHMVTLKLTTGSLSVRDICMCTGNWPSLRSLDMCGFEEGQWDISDCEVWKPTCSLDHLSLANGSILAPQLRFLTTSSHSSLRGVMLDGITGLSNTDLREWLSEIAPSLKSFELRNSFFPRIQYDEEHAVDATIHMMCRLESALFEGDTVSSLAIERKPKNKDLSISELDIRGVPSIDPPGLIHALVYTGFTEVIVNGVMVFKQNQTLGEDAIWFAVRMNLAPQPS